MPDQPHRLDYHRRDPGPARPPTDWIGAHPGIATIALAIIVYLIIQGVLAWVYA